MFFDQASQEWRRCAGSPAVTWNGLHRKPAWSTRMLRLSQTLGRPAWYQCDKKRPRPLKGQRSHVAGGPARRPHLPVPVPPVQLTRSPSWPWMPTRRLPCQPPTYLLRIHGKVGGDGSRARNRSSGFPQPLSALAPGHAAR